MKGVRSHEPEEEVDGGQLFEIALHDVLSRLITCQNIILALAKHDPEITKLQHNSWPISVLIGKARKYVSTEMLYTVGVKKLAKSWETEGVKK